jgi:hypothetical protein
MFCTIAHIMKSDREIEIMFRRLRLYDRLERRAEGLVRTIQRVMRERYGPRSRPFRNRAHARPDLRQRREILQLQRAGISTAAAELLLVRMQAKIESLCDERDRLKKEEGGSTKGRVLGGRSW